MRRSASNGRMCRSRRSSRIASMRIISPSASSSYRSGWKARAVPSSPWANARASPRLPTPGGPWKRYACAGPSRSAASSSRRGSACSLKAAKLLTDLLRDLVGWTRAVERDDPLGEERGEAAVGAVDAPEEVVPLALDPVAHPGRARVRVRGRDEQHERPVGEQTARRREVELEHAADSEPAT